MKKYLFVLLISLISLKSWSTHVIGGDISMEWVSMNEYKINAKIYRDNLSGGAQMVTDLTVGIYEIGTNIQVMSIQLPRISLNIVQLGDQCYTPDPNSLEIEEGIFRSAAPITLNDFANGYYIQSEIFARNTLAINISSNPLQGMTFYCEIPDPTIGQNSSPQFGNFPSSAYFCVNSTKIINFNTIDPDGDSLVHSFTTPLISINNTGGNFTIAGSGAYPYYPSIGWSTGYSLTNILGATSSMTMNPTTGDITAIANDLGYFTFAIKVEEFRNGVKIGEVRRDLQYASLICDIGSPPYFLNTTPTSNQTIEIPYNKEYCKDLIFEDANFSDTLYIEMISTIFDSNAYIPSLTPDANGNFHYFYNGSGDPLVWNDSVVIPANQTNSEGEFNISTIANRFCWTPTCNQIGEVFPFQVNAYSLGCDGKSSDSILFNLEVIPPTIDFKNVSDHSIPYGEEYCKNIVFHDTNMVDVLKIEITSELFSLGATFSELSTSYQYGNDVYPAPNNFLITNVPNGAANAVNVAKRFCWTPDCDKIGKSYTIHATISSLDCPKAETLKDSIEFMYTVTPPFDSLDVSPNVFTPNGDGMNDFYTLGYTNNDGERIGGISNPCSDFITIKIYSRWGQLVYESKEDPEFKWNGTNKEGNKVASGTYFVLINGIYGAEEITLKRQMVTVLDSK
jgi:gliding motility-associated-like protein